MTCGQGCNEPNEGAADSLIKCGRFWPFMKILACLNVTESVHFKRPEAGRLVFKPLICLAKWDSVYIFY